MRLLQRFLIYAMLVLGAVVFLLPLLWMISTGLKPIEQTMSMPPRWIPYKLFIEKDGQRIEVRRDELIEAPSYVVEIEGERHIVPQTGVANGQMTQQLPNGGEKVTPVHVVQEIPASPRRPARHPVFANGQLTNHRPNGGEKVTRFPVVQEIPVSQQHPWAAVAPVAF